MDVVRHAFHGVEAQSPVNRKAETMVGTSKKLKPRPFLFPQFCKACGRCIEACPKDCIELGTEIDPLTGLTPVVIDLEHVQRMRPLSSPPAPSRTVSCRRRKSRGLRAARSRASSSAPRHTTAPAPVSIPDERLPLPALEPLILKGNHASAIGALLAGCRHFFGYPITPSTEGAELMAKLLPELDGVFLQAVSEVATVNMMYGCGGAGLRCMTFTSSPGFSLMLEGISYMVGAGAARRLRQRDARRPWARQHRSGAGGHQARLPRPRTRQHPRDRARAVDAAGDARSDDARVRPDVQVPQPRRPRERRLPRTDDGARRRCPSS